ncbi:flagellar hook-basal body complex protein [Candidatus Marinarcus aquaticus]|uniref:Flagellar hook protein FlgE n=1 Tax=Candidatus Marinarcus aquaticus TaxID=2044504 RepID=A0A4Q0XSR3_9BACT|nr:flagellar hook-basal body complex protein [Candidatus Marinarcus aquaticus]RXJ56255.1 flagellar biosynthesis protein FlgE [Candidatus Marinarcus aquaticus]
MIGALWTGISGLASHQAALDNEANNIANVNTIGYKATRIAFADQVYQNRIGKGSKVLDAEKIYEQASTKKTGVSYDIALKGDGFITVTDRNNGGGTSETYYTRAGNLRMGDNGTLQDANGNEVQGWVLSSIDPDADVVTTNPNITIFTSDYTKLVSSRIINHGTYIETIAAKTTDYNNTAKGDSHQIFAGAGYNTESGKISDIQELQKAYAAALQKYQEDPDGASATSVAQVTYIDFEDKAAGHLADDNDFISVYINNKRYTQQFDTSYENTMKKLADKLTEAIPGIKVYTVDATAAHNESTADADVASGVLKIESLIPGQPFIVSNVLTTSGQTEINGTVLTSDGVAAVEGSGLGALESIRDALSEAVSGKQRDVFLPSDLFTLTPSTTTLSADAGFDYRVTIWDNDAKQNVTIPTAGPLTLGPYLTGTDALTNMADIVTQINGDPELSLYLNASIVNNALVIETKDSNFDVEFSGVLDETSGPLGLIEKNATHSGREGAGAEFIEMVTKIDQTSSKDSLQLRLDTLGISDTAFGDFSVDSNGVITIRQDGVDYAIGQISIAMFNNNRGLESIGNNLLRKTNESGDPIYSLNNAKAADVENKYVELSGADLSKSLVNLMVFQRGFEANAKSITTSDELLNTLINLKR